jgi:hypothetical protein
MVAGVGKYADDDCRISRGKAAHRHRICISASSEPDTYSLFITALLESSGKNSPDETTKPDQGLSLSLARKAHWCTKTRNRTLRPEALGACPRGVKSGRISSNEGGDPYRRDDPKPDLAKFNPLVHPREQMARPPLQDGLQRATNVRGGINVSGLFVDNSP